MHYRKRSRSIFWFFGYRKRWLWKKINALTEALESQEIKCFSETSLKNRYKDILNIFLDEEVRMYRGF